MGSYSLISTNSVKLTLRVDGLSFIKSIISYGVIAIGEAIIVCVFVFCFLVELVDEVGKCENNEVAPRLDRVRLT